MRATLVIDDVLTAAKQLARMSCVWAGPVVSAWMHTALFDPNAVCVGRFPMSRSTPCAIENALIQASLAVGHILHHFAMAWLKRNVAHGRASFRSLI